MKLMLGTIISNFQTKIVNLIKNIYIILYIVTFIIITCKNIGAFLCIN